MATDESPFSEAALQEVAARSWPAGTEVEILSVAHPFPFIPEITMVAAGVHYQTLEEERQRAAENVTRAAKEFAVKAPGLRVATKVLEGSPKKLIVEEAERWGPI